MGLVLSGGRWVVLCLPLSPEKTDFFYVRSLLSTHPKA